MQFWQPCRISFYNFRKTFAEPLLFLKNFFFLGNFFSRTVSIDTQLQNLTTPPKLFRKRSNNSPTTSESDRIVLFSLKNTLELFLWTGRMQFWQPIGNFFGKRPNFITHSPKMMENYFFFGKEPSNCPDGHGGCSFQNSAIKIFFRRPRLLAEFPKRIKRTVLQLNKLTPLFPHWHLECSFDKSIKFFLQKVQEIFHSLSGNKKEGSELEKINPSKCSNGHVKGDFDNPTINKISTKAETFSIDLRNWDEKDSFSQTVFFLKKFPTGNRNAILAAL